MRKIISLVMMLPPCTSFATNCRVIDYPDHYEAVCVGDAEQAPALSQKTKQKQIPVQEQTLASARTPESALPDVPPEKIVRNDLARSHGAYWLKSNPGQ